MADMLCWTSLIANDCFSHSLLALDYSDVWLRLSATCRTLRQAIPQTLQRNSYQLARQLVKSLVKEASSACDSTDGSKQYELALGWVLAHANIPASVVQQDMSEYLSVPSMHFAIAEQLVRAGARVSYEQLVAAARNQLEAAWTCVMSMHRQGVLTEMPAMVGALVRPRQGCSQPRLPSLADTTSESLVDMLFIAISALGHHPAPRVFSYIVSAPAAQQIDADTALKLLRAAIKAYSNSSADVNLLERCFKSLLQLPAVSDIEAPGDVSELLHLGLQCGLPASDWAELGDRVGASNLSDDAFAALLTAAVPASMQHRRQGKHPYLERVILWRPEYWSQHMQAAGSQGLLNMLISALTALGTSRTRRTTAIHHLTTSVKPPWTVLTTARQQLSVGSVVDLLRRAVDVCDSSSLGSAISSLWLDHICTLPAATAMTAEDFKQMLQAIFLAANSRTGGADALSDCLDSICNHQMAAQVTVVELKQLMQAAITTFGNRDARPGVVGCCLHNLCKLQAAAELTAGDLEQLLQMAIDLEAQECISGLLWLGLTEHLETPMRATAAAALVGITASRGDQQAVKQLLDQRILLYMNKDQAQAAAVAAVKALLKTEAKGQQQLQPGPVPAAAAALQESRMTQVGFGICVELALWQPDAIDILTAGQLVQAAVTLAQGATGHDAARELSLMLASLSMTQVFNRLDAGTLKDRLLALQRTVRSL